MGTAGTSGPPHMGSLPPGWQSGKEKWDAHTHIRTHPVSIIDGPSSKTVKMTRDGERGRGRGREGKRRHEKKTTVAGSGQGGGAGGPGRRGGRRPGVVVRGGRGVLRGGRALVAIGSSHAFFQYPGRCLRWGAIISRPFANDWMGNEREFGGDTIQCCTQVYCKTVHP
jgi:hypothetical protein